MNYETIACYYDLVHQDLTDDIPFLLTLAREMGGQVLELGCGTGRVLLPLVRAGISITGIDNSPAMLALAQSRLPRTSLIETDMATFTMSEQFNLIIISHNTLLHLTPLQMQRTLKQACRHLTPNGKLFIDLPNPLDLATTPNDHVVLLEKMFTDPQTGHTVLLFARNHLYASEQRLHITWFYDSSPPQGGTVHRLINDMDYHFVYPHEVEQLLQGAGMSLRALYGSYNKTPYAEDSPRLLVLASPTH